MFYKIQLKDDIEKVSGIFVKNGYSVQRAKKRRVKDGKPLNAFDYGIEVTGTGEDLEMEEDE